MKLICLFLHIFSTHAAIITPSSFHQPFGMSLKLLPDRLACIVSIDSRIAHFDTPIEWLQSSLQQQPCEQSAWVIVVSLPNAPDPSVVDILLNHATVDMLATTVDHSLDMSIVVVDANSTFEVSSAGIRDKNSGKIVLSERSQRVISRSRKSLSNTSILNIVWAIIISTLSGFSVNYSARAIAHKRNSYTNVLS